DLSVIFLKDKFKAPFLLGLPVESTFFIIASYPRGMDIICPYIDKTGFIFVLLQEIKGFIHKVFCAVPSFYAVLIGPNPVSGCDSRIGIRAFISSRPRIETVLVEVRRIVYIPTTTEVPFAKMSCRIAISLQHISHGQHRRIQKINLFFFPVIFTGIQESGEM